MKYIISFILISLSFEICYDNCKTCFENSLDFKNMKCITCNDGFNFIFNTFNCDYKVYYLNYYLNKSDSILYPCSLLENQNCYECDPYLNTKGKCLSCNKGYIFNDETNECQSCKENEIPIIKGDFYNCKTTNLYEYCDLYKTECIASENSKIICPDDAPFYDILNKSCNQYECQDNEFDEELCLAKSDKYKDRILFINWFKKEPIYLTNPSYNVDNSGYLLIQLNSQSSIIRHSIYAEKDRKRNLFFFNEEGRGLFDEINDIYEKEVELDKRLYRFFSTSMALKLNDSDEYSYLLNFESYFSNMELINLKTGEISGDSYLDIFDGKETNKVSLQSILIPSIQLIELNNKNQYLIYSYIYQRDIHSKYIFKIKYTIFTLNKSNKGKINIYSLKKEQSSYVGSNRNNLDERLKIFFVQTKKGILLQTLIYKDFILSLVIHKSYEIISEFFDIKLIKNAFHKLIHIKDEIIFFCYFSKDEKNYLTFWILEVVGDRLKDLMNFRLRSEKKEGIFIIQI